ncbi:response regulator [Phenylobacterium sp.]|jgi:CheY-like chemotaxis protein|uniref:response regulator n=1 Tax=Phenylobacterium sp. TaxID=1871053 RepID=UPI002F41C96D
MTAPLQGVRLLLVEDEAMVAIMLEEMLKGLGCEVVGVAGSVAQGLDALEEADRRLDAAILDVNLGGEKVYPVADRLAAKGVPYIFSTGYGLAGIAQGYARVPALAKPYGPEALEETLLTVLGDRAG